MQSPDSVRITERFFDAIQILKQYKALRGKQTFTRRYGINQRNFWQLEKDKSKDIMQIAWLKYLCEDYGVSAEWLLTGKGKIFTVEPKPKTHFKNKPRCK